MASSSLRFAEQYVDRQERTDWFRGRQFEVVTGRVVLHAVDTEGQPQCGFDRAQLTPIAQPWTAGYLPHLRRCRECAQVTGGDSVAAPASDVDIRTARGTAGENAASEALRAVLAEHDLRRWMFTDVVIVDESIRGGFSHPLTISPGLLVRRPALALTTFLHEQLHWVEGPATDGATAEASSRWPDPPPPPHGAADPRSTWLHMSVCALEYQSLAEILGTPAASGELKQHEGYSWIYGQILADPAWFAAFLERHGLQVPAAPPVPRRYIGGES
jgi:hypothetical protein